MNAHPEFFEREPATESSGRVEAVRAGSSGRGRIATTRPSSPSPANPRRMVLQEDQKLLQWFDLAVTRSGEEV